MLVRQRKFVDVAARAGKNVTGAIRRRKLFRISLQMTKQMQTRTFLIFFFQRHPLCHLSVFFMRSMDGNVKSIRLLVQRALHTMTGLRAVSAQKAAHETDQLPLTSCSNITTHANMTKPQELRGENDKAAKDIVSMHRNHSPDHHGLSLERHFYEVFCKKTSMSKNDKARFNNRMITPQGLNGKPHHTVNCDCTCGMTIMHQPWN
jgi:hypothetical protein